MSKKRKAGVPSGTFKKKTAYAAHLKEQRKAKLPQKAPTIAKPQKSQRMPLPFAKTDSVLLVGEGDFSFALALKTALHVRRITATSFDDEAELASKYPQAAANIEALLAVGSAERAAEADEAEDQTLPLEALDSDADEAALYSSTRAPAREYAVHHGVDATKLLKRRMFSKSKRRYDRIVFQFPHVGGQSKDQDRQVRYNQELLAGFFANAAPLLTPDSGQVIVTLFDGLPYDLWNIKALARKANLIPRTSTAFEASDYPGYAHVRTLGTIEGGGGWKGENRKARMYIFGIEPAWTVQNRKRMERNGSDDDD